MAVGRFRARLQWFVGIRCADPANGGGFISRSGRKDWAQLFMSILDYHAVDAIRFETTPSGPDEGFRIFVVDVQILLDCGFEFFGAPMGSTSGLVLGNRGKPALDEV